MICANCEVEADGELRSACDFLLNRSSLYKLRTNGETEGFVNRRWQMRFNRGQIAAQRGSSVLWQKKRELQDWWKEERRLKIYL